MTNQRNSVLEACLGKAVALSGLIDYAVDSVVSKTIIDKPVGTITLFAFDKGQRLSEHTAPYHATVEVVEGTGIFTIDGKDIEASAGQILIMPANIRHAVTAGQRFKMLLTMIRA
jgi:quercetin dioxygenase-like cupin family protein